MDITPSRIGFVATHFNGDDYVSRESSLWRAFLTERGHECFFFTGESLQAEERTVIVPEADFRSRDIEQLNLELYKNGERSPKTSGTIQALRFHIKQHLHQFIQTFDINLLIVENALSFPVNIPLGLALTEVIAETGIACFARHFDFAWEHPQYHDSPANDYLMGGFLPKLPSLQHIVASNIHADALAMRTGIHARVIPFVRDFQNMPAPPTLTPEAFRNAFGITHKTRLALSTSPLKPISMIETTLGLIARMDQQPELLLTAVATGEEEQYLKFIMETAAFFGCTVHLAFDQLPTLTDRAEGDGDGLGLCYQNAAFVSVRGQTQGALSEVIDSIYYGKPVVTSRHNPALQDLKRLGVQFFEIHDTAHLEEAHALEGNLQEAGLLAELAERNHNIALRHLSLDILDQKLADLMRETLTS